MCYVNGCCLWLMVCIISVCLCVREEAALLRICRNYTCLESSSVEVVEAAAEDMTG